jgi:hypothetical protein
MEKITNKELTELESRALEPSSQLNTPALVCCESTLILKLISELRELRKESHA